MSLARQRVEEKARAILSVIGQSGYPPVARTAELEDAIIYATGVYRTDRMKELIRALRVLGYIEFTDTPGVWRIHYRRAGIETEGG